MKEVIRLSATIGFAVMLAQASIVSAHDEKRVESGRPREASHSGASEPSHNHASSSESSSDSLGDAIIGSLIDLGLDAIKKVKFPTHLHHSSPTRAASTNAKIASPVRIEMPSNRTPPDAKPESAKALESATIAKKHFGKPPVNFSISQLPLANLKLSSKANPTSKVNADYRFHGDKLLINKHYNLQKDYPEKHGIRTSYGYIYRDRFNSHWHHAIWDPNAACFYFYDQYSSSYYFYNDDDNCYYPVWWVVDFATLHSF